LLLSPHFKSLCNLKKIRLEIVDVSRARISIDIFSGVIFEWDFGSGEKYRVILYSFIGIIIPLLEEYDARFCACMGLETISLDTDDCEYPSMRHHEFADVFFTCVVEYSLWKYESESPTWSNEVQVAFDKEQMTRDIVDIFSCLWVFSELELRKSGRFFDFSSKWRIREEDIKIEVKVFFFIVFIFLVFIELCEEVFTFEVSFCRILP